MTNAPLPLFTVSLVETMGVEVEFYKWKHEHIQILIESYH